MQVVVVKRVLVAIRAAREAPAAQPTARPGRALPAEERVGDGLTLSAKEDRQRLGPERVARAHRLRGRPQMVVHLGQRAVDRAAEHPLRGPVMRLELRLPVDPQPRPRCVTVQTIVGLEQHAAEHQAAAANAAPADDPHVAEEPLPEEPVHSQLRLPGKLA